MSIFIIKDEVYQPRFKAYIFHNKFSVGDSIHLHHYMSWVTTKCDEFKRLNHSSFEKVENLVLNDADQQRFTDWLLYDKSSITL